MSGSSLSVVNSMKFLGLTLDDKLTFGIHSKNLVSRLSRSIGAIRKLSYFAPTSVLISVYYSLFYSHLTYGIIVWGNSSATLTSKLSALQRRVIKLFDSSSSYSDIMNRYKLMSYPYVYRYFCVSKLYDIFSGYNNYFESRIDDVQINHSHNTRIASNSHITNIFCRTSRSQKNFLYNAIQYWNELPPELRSSCSLNQFKKGVKKYYLAEQVLHP